MLWLWTAPANARKAGFTPKTVQFTGDWNKPEDQPSLASRCAILNAEAKEFLSGQQRDEPASRYGRGTIGWICDLYMSHPQSSYREKRAATQRSYLDGFRVIQATVAQRRIDAVNGLDVREWYRKWALPLDGKEPRLRRAKKAIDALRAAIAFGTEYGDKASQQFRGILGSMRFENPPPRSSVITHDMVKAFEKIAIEAGKPSLALVLRLQIDTTLRQKDIIGEWVTGRQSGIISNHRSWQHGLVWGENIKSDWTLFKPTSKSNGRKIVEVDLKAYPDTLALLQSIPLEKRIGPIVISEETGLPHKADNYRKWFRRFANQSGIPKDTWSMDSRAGGITESISSGANEYSVMKQAGQSQITTTQRYDRERLSNSVKIADLRTASRNRLKT